MTLLLGVAGIAYILHLACLTRYGWFRDELYYLVCADHPAAGYVDHPPLSIWLLGVWRAAFGESLTSIRVPPALAHTACAFLAGALARALGGQRGAQALAALAVVVAPVMMGVTSFYSMNAIELVVWPAAMLALLAAVESGSLRHWALLGVVLGIGLLAKISVLWLGAGFAAGLLATPYRRVLLGPGPYVAVAIAGALFAPHVAWQVANGWPTLEFMRNATGDKMADVSPVAFVLRQLLDMGPWTAPVWIAGLIALLAARTDPRRRMLGVAFLTVAVILVAAGRSRASYLTPAYPPLLAMGAVVITHARWRWLAPAGAALLIVGGAVGAPLALPLLPVDTYIAYSKRLGLAPRSEERQEVGPLPQHFADQFGWPELTDVVARAFATLTPEERAHTMIFAQNYGEAGAVTVLGRTRRLPPARSGHNNFWLWGPGPEPRVVIILGGDAEDHAPDFERLDRAGTATSPYAMPYERNLPIWIGRGLRTPVAKLWPSVRLYI